jgi:hypothetical protein
MSRRGEEIRFVAGTYVGYTGWIDDSREKTVKSTPVIVHSFKKKDGSLVDKAATVRKTSIRSASIPAPTSRAEATMQQNPKIEQMMVKLCQKLAKCAVSPSDDAIYIVFNEKLQAAVAKQIALGRDAEWIGVDFNPTPGNDDGKV